jgi:hypothetical protein
MVWVIKADHPSFVGTLFLPQHTSTATAPRPLISGLLKACLLMQSPDGNLTRLSLSYRVSILEIKCQDLELK